MAEEELWRGEREQRYRIMDRMEEDRAARERQVLGGRRGREEGEYQQRLDEQQGSHRGRGPRNYRRSDERITEDINERLTDARDVDATEIQVHVASGEVTLTGTVDHRSGRRRAEEIAEEVGGVSFVMNNLRVRQAGTSGATG
ncbi:MAG: BON domain-containing protein, partial [Geminicoccaceae bacterium]